MAFNCNNNVKDGEHKELTKDNDHAGIHMKFVTLGYLVWFMLAVAHEVSSKDTKNYDVGWV